MIQKRTAALGAIASIFALAAGMGPIAGPAAADQASSRFPASFSGRIDSGVAHSCMIAGDGKVHCWGYGEVNGQLGYGNENDIGDDESPASAGAVDLGPGRTAKQLTSGTFHNCAILDTGALKCWGFNVNGQLGYGNTTAIGDDETPAAVGTVNLGAGRTAKAVSAGEAHTCAVLDNGTVRCWGGGNFGQLGYGNTTTIGDNETPASVGTVDLGGGHTAVAISAGTAYTCAILDTGAVKCWGLNAKGQLGYGNTTTIGDNETPASVGTVDLGGGHTAVAISAGWNNTCAILDDGSVKCWGSGEEGKLGYGNTNDVLSPASVGTVDLGAGRTAVAISASTNHTCAILDNGTVRCWGDGIYGQLGYGNQQDVGDNETPGSVGPIDIGAGRKAVGITTGRDFTCVMLDNGAVRCWGDSSYGQLGYGSKDRIGDNESPAAAGPANLGAGAGALETAAGGNHTCARFDTGIVRCWGLGSFGQLGYGNTTTIGDNETPASVGTVDLGGVGAVQIVTGESHTCALLADGTVRCWGMGLNGRLGYGNQNDIGDNETPSAVSPVSLGGSAVRITAGASHTCALLAGGTVRCWGLGTNGQLGYGNTTTIGDDESPSTVGPVSLGASAVGITAGANHTCALLAGGTVRCWGLGVFGQLGYGNTTTIGDNESPSTVGPVSLGGSAVRIAAGANHTCATLADGTVRCWGLGLSGRLGYANVNTIGDNEAPSTAGAVNVGSGRDVTMVAGGESHTCAVLDNGTVRCWGEGANGRLGYANQETIGDDELPGSVGPVELGLNALGVTAGASHTCATLADGAVRCWGLGIFGQLGYGNTTTIGDDETPAAAGPVDFSDDPPVAVDDSKTVSEDAAATALGVLTNDTDVDGGSKVIESATQPSHGAVAITGGGSDATYTPNANYCGPDSFTYTLNGGSTATVSVTVTCVDDPPVAVDDSATLAEDASATAIDVLSNDTDIDGGTKLVSSKTDGMNGAVAITGGGTGLTYQPASNYCGGDSFTYQLNGGSTATVSVTVTCVDDPPVAVDDSKTVNEDAAATALGVLTNDTDVDGGSKVIESATQPSHGAVAITGGGSDATYTPNANYCGPDSFTYTLNGGSTATVSVTVTCVDDPPVAVDDSDTVLENSGASAIDVLANDTDIDGGPRSVIGKTNGAHGAVSVIGGGAGLTYTPNANYCGPDSFTYTLNGGSAATVAITVTCVEDLEPPEKSSSGDSQSNSSQTIFVPPASNGPVVKVTPGVGVVSGRHHPRIAVKGVYAFFTLTCQLEERDCSGVVKIAATIPSPALGPTMEKLAIVKGRFRIGPRRSVLVRARLSRRGLRALDAKRSLRGVSASMTIVDSGNDERGQIQVTLVRRPKASELGGKKRSRS